MFKPALRVAGPLGRHLSESATRAAAQRCHESRRAFSISQTLDLKKYTKDHEWVELSADGKIGTVGVSAYAAKALGDVVYVELPAEDLKVSGGDPLGAVESVKSASDIMTPISGVVIEANTDLEETPSKINKSPEQDGWIAKISVKNKKELDTLMDEGAYKEFTEK
ncbi:MAG: glycine cleavage system H-protein subunit [Vezdaea aestivalis]|nr:MAG: glycine cleavage system H-protein subunit [Vezdaea aestivalis]